MKIKILILISLLSLWSCSNSGSGLTKTAITADTHTHFPINSTSTHPFTTCNDCHGSFSTFTEYSCIDGTCHVQADTDPLHAGMSGYVYDGTTCYNCHPSGTGSISRTDHDPLFPIETGTHGGIACDDCHANPLDRRDLKCTSCHSTNDSDPARPSHDNETTTMARHASVSSFQYLSSDCYGCHPKGSAALGDSLDHDSFFPNSSGTKHAINKVFCCTPPGTAEVPCGGTAPATCPGATSGSGAATITCTACHLSTSDRSQINCANQTCHPSSYLSTIHIAPVIPGYSYVSSACYSCHPQGNGNPTTGVVVNHTAVFLRGAGTKHAVTTTKIVGTTGVAGTEIRCRDCHSDLVTWTNVKCVTCHVKTITDSSHSVVRSGTGGYVWNTADCLSCHPTPSVFRVRDHNRCVSHKTAKCRNCHRATLSGKPFPATDFSQHSCTYCHSNRSSC